MTFINENFLWEFYPDMKWKLLFSYFLGILVLSDYQFQFTFFCVLIIGWILYFHRKPELQPVINHTHQICNIDGTCRTTASTAFSSSNEILSPAWGQIARIEKQCDNRLVISISLTLLNIHAQYCPISGKVINKQYHPGTFHLSGLLEKSDKNEHQLIEIQNSQGLIVGVKQIAGMMTRRITSPLEINDIVSKSEYLGFIHFGSRVDVILPTNKVQLLVQEGDTVNGFNTKLAVFGI